MTWSDLAFKGPLGSLCGKTDCKGADFRKEKQTKEAGVDERLRVGPDTGTWTEDKFPR